MNNETPENSQNSGENQEQNLPQEWYNVLGYESEDVFKQEFEQLKTYKSLAAELEEKQKDIEDGFALLQEAEDPYAGNEEARMLVQFSKKGIPSSISSKMMSLDAETMMEDPLSALIVAEAVKNPEKFKKLGQETIEEAVREKYGIGFDGDYTPTALMKSDALDAIDAITKVKKEIADAKNPFIFAKELKSQNEKSFADRQSLAFSEAESFSKQIKDVPYKFGENQISLQVSSEEVEAVLKSQYASYLGRAFDASTKEGKQQVRDWVSNQILVHKLQSGDIGIQIQNALQAGAEKKAVQTVFNGQPKMVNRSGKTNVDAKGLTPAQRDLMDRGLPIPSQQIQSNNS